MIVPAEPRAFFLVSQSYFQAQRERERETWKEECEWRRKRNERERKSERRASCSVASAPRMLVDRVRGKKGLHVKRKKKKNR